MQQMKEKLQKGGGGTAGLEAQIEELRDQLSGAAEREEIILKGGGHFLLEDIPDAYIAEVIKFLSDISGA